jgi:hypothetical protein
MMRLRVLEAGVPVLEAGVPVLEAGVPVLKIDFCFEEVAVITLSLSLPLSLSFTRSRHQDEAAGGWSYQSVVGKQGEVDIGF